LKGCRKKATVPAVAAHDQFDRKHQNGGDEQADETIAYDRPFAPRQIAGGRIVFQKSGAALRCLYWSLPLIPRSRIKRVTDLSPNCHAVRLWRKIEEPANQS
jgi:hypothetical protein